jgi:hypothetical protein
VTGPIREPPQAKLNLFLHVLGRRGRSHAEQAVLGVQRDARTLGQMVGNQGRQSDPEVHVGPGRDVGGHASCQLRPAQWSRERRTVRRRTAHETASFGA